MDIRVVQAGVSYGREFPTGKYRLENVGVSLRVEFDSLLEDTALEIHRAYDQAKEIVETRAKDVIGMSKARIEA